MENCPVEVEVPLDVTHEAININLVNIGDYMTLQELEKRLRVLEDIEEIKKIHYRYFNGLTTSNFEEILPCFSKNGVVDTHAGIAKTPEERKEFFRILLSQHHIGKEGNFMVHPIISVNGDKATGSWLVYLQFAQPRKMSPRPSIFTTDDAPDWMQGFYDMEYIRENGEWKLSYMKFRCRLMSPMHTLVGFHQ
jgi:hypothetical protein